jgi:dolichol-phosphate mannosyltransferase
VAGGGTDGHWGWFRWLNSRVATLLARPFSRARDPLAGFFVIPRDVYRRAASLDPVGYKIGLELLVKAGCTRVHEVPIQFADRQRGASKLTMAEQLRYLHHLKKLADYKYEGLSQLMQFCLVGASGMLVDLLCYLMLLSSGLTVPIARGLAILAAMNWNFALNNRITFARTAAGRVGVRYIKFLWSCSFGGAMSWSVAVLTPALIPWFRAHLILAALAGIAVGTLVNFQLSRVWVFPGRGASGQSDQ